MNIGFLKSWKYMLLQKDHLITNINLQLLRNYFNFQIYLVYCSVDEQLAKDVQLVDLIAEKQAQIFSEEFKLFPADVQIQSIYPL